MSSALFFLLVLGSSLAANLLIFVPVAAWWRGVLARQAHENTAGAFQLLFGHVTALRGRAVVFHVDGTVSTHDAKAFLKAKGAAPAMARAAAAAAATPIPVMSSPPQDTADARRASGVLRAISGLAAPSEEEPHLLALHRSREALRAAERGDEIPDTSRGAS